MLVPERMSPSGKKMAYEPSFVSVVADVAGSMPYFCREFRHDVQDDDVLARADAKRM